MGGTELRHLALKFVACKLHNAELWRGLASRTVAIGRERRLMSPRDLALIMNAFKRMGISEPALLSECERIVTDRLHEFSGEDLALVALSYAAMEGSTVGLLMTVADRVCQQADEGRPPQQVLSWVHLVGALAKAGVPHQECFQFAAPPICDALEGRERFAGRLIAKIAASYARFGYKHDRLLELLAKRIPTVYLSDAEILLLQRSFKALQFEDGTLDRIVQLRLNG
ncbi:unnamed protein product [Vitrella brassicaformis CCMP3155]|uniref:FAST kinase leucine-rich domain-containing protein n=1 Tax=Vitrella brassicaformis (strain CCMP3155) TaxID=1169540 RepID=A0A0G4EI67_VITBC|nr:unnamed protein product [Vitrella brassicaformis CCMP3155]|eukprot:CEL95943.1 unnamed protein product [Vitrella brassicaformis CCMP3155]